jgi:hypothetical protein
MLVKEQRVQTQAPRGHCFHCGSRKHAQLTCPFNRCASCGMYGHPTAACVDQSQIHPFFAFVNPRIIPMFATPDIHATSQNEKVTMFEPRFNLKTMSSWHRET